MKKKSMKRNNTKTTAKRDYNKLKEIIFYSRKIITVPFGKENNEALAMTALKNLSDYGFTLDLAGIEVLKTASAKKIEDWYYKTSEQFSKLAGGNHTYSPFYPNFPEEVMEKSDLELFLDQLMHYISVAVSDVTGDKSVIYKPQGENKKETIKSLEEHPLKVVQTIPEKESEIQKLAEDVFANTLSTKYTPSPSDTENIINAYIQAEPEWTKYATVIENRLILSYLYTIALMQGKSTDSMPSLVTNDYLRIAQTYSWMKQNKKKYVDAVGNICNSNSTGKVVQQKVVSLPRKFRRFIAEGLETQKNLEEDIARNTPQWNAVFHIMHIGEMQHCKRVLAVEEKIRTGKTLVTFYSRIEKAFSEKKYLDALRMYASRPGEFIKNLNRMLMIKIDDKEVSATFAKELITTATKVFSQTRPEDLIKLIGYLKSRTREDRIPVHNVKGNLFISDTCYAPIPEKTASLFIELAKNAIGTQIATGEEMGKVYIDSSLAKAPVPVDISDKSDAMNAYPRGTRIPIERNADGTAKNMRAFVWWTNMKITEGDADWFRVDLDLSANFYKKQENSPFTFMFDSVAYHSSYYKYGVTHSGDITDGGDFGGNGVCEYIDFNIQQLKDADIDYVQIYVNSFTGQPFGLIPHLCGWQERMELDKSKQFDVKAVKQTSMLNKDSCGVVMAIIDVNAEEIIWVDSPNKSATMGSNSMSVNCIDTILERYTHGDLMNMAELASIAVKANNGTLVDSIDEADVIFCFDIPDTVKPEQRVISAKNQDVWLGEFMTPYVPKKEEKDDKPNDKTEDDNTGELYSIADILSDMIDDEFAQ